MAADTTAGSDAAEPSPATEVTTATDAVADPEETYRRIVGVAYDLVARVVGDRGAAGDVRADLLVARAWVEAGGPLGGDAEPETPETAEQRVLAAAMAAALDPAAPRREVEPAEERSDLAAGRPDARDAGLDADLLELAWAAAVGIRRDQYLVLDLRHRRGLGAAGVAGVLGVAPGQAAVQLRGAREAFRNHFRRELVARQRPHCRRLATIVPGRASGLSAETRVAVDRHVRRCRRCRAAGGQLSKPEVLLADFELVSPPPSLSTRDSARALLGPPPKRRRRLPAPLRSIGRHRRAAALVAAALAAGAAAVVVVARGGPSDQGERAPEPPAQSAGPVTGGTVSKGFAPAPFLQRFVVPCGVTSVRVVAVGGSGGAVPQGGRPGRGAVVAADVPVSAGETLVMRVGENATSAPTGGGSGGAGGTGLGVVDRAGKPVGDLVTAGGGGGAGAAPVGIPGAGGAGGDADAPGEPAVGSYGGAGGAPGGDVTGGPGGIGGAGPLGSGHAGGQGAGGGGSAGEPNGGGGGGGHQGGGGGGGGGSAAGATRGGGGGGGGGSSYLAAGTSNPFRSVDPLRAPRLTITYTTTTACPAGS